MMVSSVFLILTTSPSLAWIVAISLPLLAVVVWYVAVKTRPLSEKQQATLDKINQYARENLTGLRVIRAFAREDFQEKKFASENAVYADNSNKLFNRCLFSRPFKNLSTRCASQFVGNFLQMRAPQWATLTDFW